MVLQFEEAEKCEDVNEVTRKKKAADGRITFIKITDVQLGSKVLKSLGKSVRCSAATGPLCFRELTLGLVSMSRYRNTVA